MNTLFCQHVFVKSLHIYLLIPGGSLFFGSRAKERQDKDTFDDHCYLRKSKKCVIFTTCEWNFVKLNPVEVIYQDSMQVSSLRITYRKTRDLLLLEYPQ